MITIRSGLPGSGKTLRSITKGIEAVAAGREVFELGINGIDHAVTGIKPAPFDSLERWQELPQGALLLVDEAQRWLKPRGASSTVPDWIEAFTRNRHLGVDIVLITQDPMLMDSYVRRLCNYHEHLVRLEGNFERARVFYAEGLMELRKGNPPASAAFELWPYPQQNYALYKSAVEHTVKRYVPQRLKVAAVGAVVVCALIAVAGWALAGIGKNEGGAGEPATATPPAAQAPAPTPSPVTAPAKQAASTLLGVGERRAVTWTTAAEYVVAHTPVIEGQPWTAPVYAGERPKTVPDIFCMSSAKSCTCLSEQGTRIIVREAVCRTIAREGSYNPYRPEYGISSRSGIEQRTPRAFQ